MKIPKEAARTARQLIRLTVRDGTVDESFAKVAVQKLATDKPRHYLAILSAYQRKLRQELEQRHAVIDSAAVLSSEEQSTVIAELKKKYGNDLTSEFRVDAELLGGMKVKLGSNVWDGTIKTRLKVLQDSLLS